MDQILTSSERPVKTILDLPSVPLSRRGEIPGGGVYFVITRSNVVLYIGQSGAIGTRWSTGEKYREIKHLKGLRVAWITVEDFEARISLEYVLVDRFRPALNKRWSGCPLVRETRSSHSSLSVESDYRRKLPRRPSPQAPPSLFASTDRFLDRLNREMDNDTVDFLARRGKYEWMRTEKTEHA